MPPDDPGDYIAQSRREMGHSRQLEQPRLRVPPNPSYGGSTGYAEWFRQQQIEKYDNVEPINCSSVSESRKSRHGVCSTIFVREWRGDICQHAQLHKYAQGDG